MAAKISRRTFIRTSAIAGAGLGLGFYGDAKSGVKMNQPFDTILANGVIYTGDGKAPIAGDLGIKNGRIAAIGKLGEYCDNIIDVEGMVISPGFIDIHTHTDSNLFQCPLGDSRIYQGITTDIGGNCGGSPFPSSRWKDIGGFYDALNKNGIGINYKSYTGQGQLRSAVVGDNDVPVTKNQLKDMKKILDKEMEMGSLGLSCGLEYAPGSYATDEEIVELCKIVAKHNGLFAIHMRNEDDRVEEAVKEAIAISRKSGVRLQISHLKAQNSNNWHKGPALLKLIEQAHSEGIDVAFDRYPYIAFSTGLSSFIPLTDRQGSREDVVARLKNESSAKSIGEYAERRIKSLGGLKNVVITSAHTDANRQYIGKNLEECCTISGLEPWPFIRKLLVEDNIRPQIVGFAMTEDNVKMFLSHPLGMPASDGSVYSPEGSLSRSMPHPRSYGTFPRFIGKYCRDEKLMDLSSAIQKCTALPASRLNLKERGLLIPNYHADILVFNPDTLIDISTFDNPHRFAQGIEHVFVNGTHTIRSGKPTGFLSGSVI